ncbi:MAG: hypothetical protein HN576_10000 [Bacteriovoracaceae bacterium]|jgi:hypothetical protein|nr:hypothetical protein [Bacteriovoracaceae bacterium]
MYRAFFCFLFSSVLFSANLPEKTTGNRFYIAEKIHSIFGDHSNKYTKKHILSRPEIFGGPCRINETDVGVIDKSCIGRIYESKESINSPRRRSQKSILNLLCNQLINDPVLYSFYKSKIINSANENVFKVIQLLFNDFVTLKRDDIAYLDKTYKSKDKDFIIKNFTLYTCMDSKWYTF